MHKVCFTHAAAETLCHIVVSPGIPFENFSVSNNVVGQENKAAAAEKLAMGNPPPYSPPSQQPLQQEPPPQRERVQQFILFLIKSSSKLSIINLRENRRDNQE
jgi:hypothetical protein